MLLRETWAKVEVGTQLRKVEERRLAFTGEVSFSEAVMLQLLWTR